MEPELLVLSNIITSGIVAIFGRARERRPGAFAPGLAVSRAGEKTTRAVAWGIAAPGRLALSAMRSGGVAASRATGQVIDGWVEIAAVAVRAGSHVFAAPGAADAPRNEPSAAEPGPARRLERRRTPRGGAVATA